MKKLILLLFLYSILNFQFICYGNENCTPSVQGLTVCVNITGNMIFLDKDNKINITFKNVSDKPIRIHFVLGEVFRSFQSDFIITGKYMAEPYPHGYEVTHEDFHLIQPNSKISFTQTLLKYDFNNLESGKNYNLRYKYQNKITKWKGGTMTLDGPTKELFGGKKIPYIWTGQINLVIPIITK